MESIGGTVRDQDGDPRERKMKESGACSEVVLGLQRKGPEC